MKYNTLQFSYNVEGDDLHHVDWAISLLTERHINIRRIFSKVGGRGIWLDDVI